MAWLYLPASVVLTSESISSIPTQEPFVMSRGKCIAPNSFQRKCVMENWLMHPFTAMLKPSHPLLISSLTKWTSSLPVSHVNPSVPPETEKVHLMTDGSGMTSLKLLASLDPVSCSWRTSQTSLMIGMPFQPFLKPFPKSGSMLNGQLFERLTLALTIKETVSSSLPMLPTPTKSDGVRNSLTYGAGNFTLLGKLKHLEMLPTPTKSDAEGGIRWERGNRKQAQKLRDELMIQHKEKLEMLPTLTVNDAKNHTLPPSQLHRDCNTFVRHLMREMLPTPTSSDPFKQTTGGLHRRVVQGRTKSSEASLRQVPGGKINPMFCEWMMGFPLGWTDLEDSETP